MMGARSLSVLSVAFLTLLSAGSAAWSGFTNPNVAAVQLQIARENLAAASSFTAVVDVTESVFGTSEVGTVHQVVHYQAPDREFIFETGHEDLGVRSLSYTRTLTQIGDSCWTTVSTSAVGPFACQTSTVQVLPFSAAELSSVTDNDGLYALSGSAAELLLKQLDPGPTGMAAFEARIAGEYISRTRVSFVFSQSNAAIGVVQTTQFSDFGSSPPIVVPPGPPTAIAA
jgi:hypothetical protein